MELIVYRILFLNIRYGNVKVQIPKFKKNPYKIFKYDK